MTAIQWQSYGIILAYTLLHVKPYKKNHLAVKVFFCCRPDLIYGIKSLLEICVINHINVGKVVITHRVLTGQRSFIVWIYDFGVNLPHVYMASVFRGTIFDSCAGKHTLSSVMRDNHTKYQVVANLVVY